MAPANSAKKQCRICDAGEGRLFRRGAKTYLRCRNCGSITMLLTEAEYRALGVTYDAGPLESADDPEAIRQTLRIEEKIDFLKPLLAKLQLSAPPRVLDIGCGQGGILLAARDLGCRVKGVEPSRSHSKIARAIFGLDVIDGYFDAAALRADKFDLVILSHVIEHIFQPGEFLENVMKVVTPGGLLIVVTPNAASAAARLCGPWWAMLKPADHVSMLTDKALRRLCPSVVSAITVRQSEYAWEPLVTLLQAARDRWRERRLEEPSAPTSAVSAATFGARLSRFERYMWLLSALSWPLHLVNSAVGAQACLIAELRRGGSNTD